MSLESKKLQIIDRFMKLKDEQSINRLEALLTELELNHRAEKSEQDINHNDVRSYDEFCNEVDKWLKNKSSK